MNSVPREIVHGSATPSAVPVRLEGDRAVDAVVVGGGMAGLFCAERLHAGGKRVALVEAGMCGDGASGKSSGFITPDSELELSNLVRNYGAAEAKRLWEFARGGVEAIRETILQNAIECDYREQDSLFAAASSAGWEVVRKEHEAQRSLGFPSTLYARADLPAILGTNSYFGAVRYPGTFGINGARFCSGMRDLLIQRGVEIYEETPVHAILDTGVATERGTLTARQVVVCTDRFLPELGLCLRAIYHIQTFLGLTAPLTNTQALALFPHRELMVWDTNLIYTYYRLVEDRRLLIGGCNFLYTYLQEETHAPGRMAGKMHKFLTAHFPAVPFTFEFVWPGLIGISKDFAPLAGTLSGRPSVSFCGGAAGLPWAAALGRYLAEKILNGRGELDAFLSPARKFPLPDAVQAVAGKPLAFALNHGAAKYFRK